MFKQFKFTIIALASLAMVFTSCKKEEETPQQETPKNCVTCKINGADWSSLETGRSIKMEDTTLQAVSATLQADTLSLALISVKGTDTSLMSVYSVLSDGRRSGNFSESAVMYFPSTDINTIFDIILNYEVNSTFSLTGFNADKKTISGTFTSSNTRSGGGGPDYNITDGKFNDIPFTVIP